MPCNYYSIRKIKLYVFEKDLKITFEFILIGAISIGYLQIINNHIEGKLSDRFLGKVSLHNLSEIISKKKKFIFILMQDIYLNSIYQV